jgi:hypothetical protein
VEKIEHADEFEMSDGDGDGDFVCNAADTSSRTSAGGRA